MARNKSSPKYVFVWDLDDTLIWTSWAYSRAFATFHKYMEELFGGRLIELRTLGTISEEIDKNLIKTINPNTSKPYGYSMERFPASFVKTYEWLCEHGFGTYQEMIARRVSLIGNEAFDPLGYKKQGMVEGAQEVLDFIHDQSDMQILVTKGEKLVQDSKIVTLNLDTWFGKEIYVVDSKNKDTFAKICERFPDSVIFSVGNSFGSDIQPALDAGIMGIFIPYYSWIGEAPPPEIDIDRVFKIDDIKDLISLYPELPSLKTPRKDNS